MNAFVLILTVMADDAGDLQTLELYSLSSYAKNLVHSEHQLNVAKLATIDCDNPYLFPVDVYKMHLFAPANSTKTFLL